MNRDFSINLFFVAGILAGIFCTPFISFKFHPSSTTRRVYIVTSALGWTATNLEKDVTSILEGQLTKLDFVEELSSLTQQNSSRIELKIKPEYTTQYTRYVLSNLIRSIYPKLPKGVNYPEIQDHKAEEKDLAFRTYAFYANSYELLEPFINKELSPLLHQQKGIASIEFIGERKGVYSVYFEPEVWDQYQLTLSEVKSLIQNSVKTHTIESVQINKQYASSFVINEEQLDFEKLKTIPVTVWHGKMVYLNEVATFKKEDIFPQNMMQVNGLPSIQLHVNAHHQENRIALGNTVDQLFEKNTKKWSEKGIQYILQKDEAKELKAEIQTVVIRMLLSILLLFGFVYLLNQNYLYVFLLLVAVVATESISLLFIYLLDIEINIYSLSGVGIALGIVMDNMIVKMDFLHLKKRGDVFPVIICATLTTIGALSIVFFLEGEQRSMLQSFVYLMIINLGISLVVTKWFVPALYRTLPLQYAGKKQVIANKKWIIRLEQIYRNQLHFCIKYRIILILAFSILFGLPVFLLPERLPSDHPLAQVYNPILGKSSLRKKINTYLGGSLYYFIQHKGAEGFSFQTKEEHQKLIIDLTAEHGHHPYSLQKAIRAYEELFAQNKDILWFSTDLAFQKMNIAKGRILICFRKTAPLHATQQVQVQVAQAAKNRGTVETSIIGGGLIPFSNTFSDTYLSQGILLKGFQYEKLMQLGNEIGERLRTNKRVKNLEIRSIPSKIKSREKQWQANWHTKQLLSTKSNIEEQVTKLEMLHYFNLPLNGVKVGDRQLRFIPKLKENWSSTDLHEYRYTTGGGPQKVKHVLELEPKLYTDGIQRENQSYIIQLAYNFTGSSTLASYFQKKIIEEAEKKIPVGFSVEAEDNSFSWKPKDWSKWGLAIAIVVLIIYFICVIALNNLIQASGIILILPLSLIGPFFCYGGLPINFGIGGLSAILLLFGLVINAALYVIYQYNILKKYSRRKIIDLYIRAISFKIIPILLTLISTVISLLPFVFVAPNNFWESFAVGTISGLLVSLIILLYILPLLMIKSTKSNTNRL